MNKQLYPTPKTQAERDAIDAARKTRQKRELPRMPWLLIPLIGGVVFWVTVQFTQIAPKMWETGSMAFIFFSFGLWLCVGGLVVAWAAYAHRALYAHGKSLHVFWPGALIILLAIIGFQWIFPSILIATGVFSAALFIWCGVFFTLGREPRKQELRGPQPIYKDIPDEKMPR